MNVDPKDSAVDEDPVFEVAMRAAPAAAWEVSFSERVPVYDLPEVRIPDARPNDVLEVSAMCSPEKGG